MPTCQLLLFPDPRPLVDRLGAAFFRALPESAGVYLMRDKADAVLYVGKAKNLRKRLTHYRVANPDRMPRRHLRLLRAVLTRLLWRAVRDQAFTWEMPAGWVHDQFARVTRIDCTIAADDAIACLERLRAGDPVSLCEWVSTRCESVCHPFERIALAEDIESLKEMMRVKPRKMEDG